MSCTRSQQDIIIFKRNREKAGKTSLEVKRESWTKLCYSLWRTLQNLRNCRKN